MGAATYPNLLKARDPHLMVPELFEPSDQWNAPTLIGFRRSAALEIYTCVPGGFKCLMLLSLSLLQSLCNCGEWQEMFPGNEDFQSGNVYRRREGGFVLDDSKWTFSVIPNMVKECVPEAGVDKNSN